MFLYHSHRLPRRQLRGEHRRLPRPSVPERRHVHRCGERVPLPLQSALCGRTLRERCGRVRLTAERLPEWGDVHEHTRWIRVHLRERLDGHRLQHEHR